MGFENLDASTFYVTTTGENQAPARQLFTNAVRKKNPWLATPNGRRYRNLSHRSGRNVAVSRGLWPPELTNQPGGPWLGHRESHFPSHFLCAGAPNKTKAGPEAKRSTHARPNRHDCRGSSQPHLLLMCICFASCISGVLVHGLT